MTFDNLFKDCECDCLAESFECQQKFIYLRKLNKAEVEEKDFLTHWERGKEPETNECDHVCGFRGISISISPAFQPGGKSTMISPFSVKIALTVTQCMILLLQLCYYDTANCV